MTRVQRLSAAVALHSKEVKNGDSQLWRSPWKDALSSETKFGSASKFRFLQIFWKCRFVLLASAAPPPVVRVQRGQRSMAPPPPGYPMFSIANRNQFVLLELHHRGRLED
ncbi:hypothetical protein PIIN_05078 [Serendipita indica DSM 11827]|uniref:Uncharacterized protein n=1 Tax=Serendipita indica (strain DSM 11827) TaxID=1109443 RepID=G4TIJ9_SERID|nr:hypothetical protein PIIN_05078 [Serendipita indica DSM 11827]